MNNEVSFYLLVLPDRQQADLVNSWIFTRALLVRQTSWEDLLLYLKGAGISYERVELSSPDGDEKDSAEKWIQDNGITCPVVALREALNPVDVRIAWFNR